VVAITTGAFSLPKATGTFVAIVVCEILFGAAVGWLSLRARHRVRDPQIEITCVADHALHRLLGPEHFGGSGVIATVACGSTSAGTGRLLISSATRLQGIFFWDLVIYLVEGLLFLLTGFQMRLLSKKSKAFPLDDILFATVLVAVIIIVARFAWVYPADLSAAIFQQAPARTRPILLWQNVFVIAFTGVRGAVSLATPWRCVYASRRRGISVSRPYPVRQFRRDFHHPGRTRIEPAPRGQVAQGRECGPRRATLPSTKRKYRRDATRWPLHWPRSTP